MLLHNSEEAQNPTITVNEDVVLQKWIIKRFFITFFVKNIFIIFAFCDFKPIKKLF